MGLIILLGLLRSDFYKCSAHPFALKGASTHRHANNRYIIEMSDPRKMFYGAGSKIFELAKENRKNLTKSEFILWSRLRDNQLGLRFRSQHPIGKYIADFYCHQSKLIIELDGAYHETNDQKNLDSNRTKTIEDYGLKVLRFTNSEVETNLENVIAEIKKHIKLLWIPPTK